MLCIMVSVCVSVCLSVRVCVCVCVYLRDGDWSLLFSHCRQRKREKEKISSPKSEDAKNLTCLCCVSLCVRVCTHGYTVLAMCAPVREGKAKAKWT